MTEWLLIGSGIAGIWFTLGIMVGVWVTRSSGEFEQRALETAWPFAIELINGELRRKERADGFFNPGHMHGAGKGAEIEHLRRGRAVPGSRDPDRENGA